MLLSPKQRLLASPWLLPAGLILAAGAAWMTYQTSWIVTLAIIPAAFILLALFLSVELASYLVTFFLFTGIAWGLELPGGFFLVTAMFIGAWLIHQMLKPQPELVLDVNMFLLLVYLLALAVSILDAPLALRSLEVMLSHVKIAIFYVIFVNAIESRNHTRGIIWMAIVSVAISTLYGFYELYMNVVLGDFFEGGVRLRGLTYNPNVMGLNLLVIVSFLTYFFFISAKTTRTRVLFALAAIAGIGALGTTLSRAAFMGLGALLVIVAWQFRSRKWPIVLLALGVSALLILLPDLFIDKLTSIVNPRQDPSLRWRLRLYEGAFALIQQHPFNGLGLGHFAPYSISLIPKYLDNHNTFLELWSESGFFAVFFFSMFYVVALRKLSRITPIYRNMGSAVDYAICMSLRTSLICVLISSVFNSLHLFYVVWVLFALVALMERYAPAPGPAAASASP